MKNTVLTSAIALALLFLILLGTTSLNTAEANPAPLFPFPWNDPVTTTPTIVIHSPIQSQTYNSTRVWLNFTLVKPETWFPDEYWRNFGYNEATFGNVTSVYYVVDSGSRQNIVVHDIDTPFTSTAARTLNFSINLALTDGAHKVIINLEADSFYAKQTDQGFRLLNITLNGNPVEISFSINTLPPRIRNISIENGQRFVGAIPLSFVISEPVSWMGYSLDGLTNVTLAGNTTLSELQIGFHNLTVYAQSESGKVGASETVYFNVDAPFPTILVITATTGTLLVMVGIGLLVYFKKNKR